MKLTEITQHPGTYAGVRFDEYTTNQLNKLSSHLAVPNPVNPSDYHTTLLYSRKYLPNYSPMGQIAPPIIGTPAQLEVWPQKNGKSCLLLKYDCPRLVDRHNFLMNEHQATWDHPSYIPHITLSYDVDSNFLEGREIGLQRLINRLHIVNEYSEPIDETWRE